MTRMLWRRRLIHRGLQRLGSWQHWLDRRLTPLGRFLLGAGLAAGVFGIDTRMNLLHQAFALLVALFLVAGLAAGILERRWRQPMTAVRGLPRYATIDRAISYPVTLQAPDGLDLTGFSLEEPLPDPRPSLETFLYARLGEETSANPFDRAMGYPRWRRLIRLGRWAERPIPQPLTAGPGPGEWNARITLHPLRRGYLRLTGLALTRPDPLGLFRIHLPVPCEHSLLVLPRRYPAPRLDLPGRRQYQPGGMTLASSVGDSQEFIGLREYRSGDPPRRIHWPSWARSGRPQVKEYQDEFFTRHALILDTFSDRAFDPRFEAAVSVAASLCESLQSGESLLDLMFVGTETYCFTAGRSLAGTEQFLEVLACAHRCDNQPFDRLRQAVLQRSGLLSAAVCILLDFDEPRRALVRGLQGAGLPLRVLLIASEAERAPRLAGWNGPAPTLIDPDRLAEGLAGL